MSALPRVAPPRAKTSDKSFTLAAMAAKVKDLSLVLALGGATLGNALIYVFPAFMFRAAVQKKGSDATAGLKKEVKVAMASAVLGIVLGALGVKTALSV